MNNKRLYRVLATACVILCAGVGQGVASVILDGDPAISFVAVPGIPAGALADGYSTATPPYPSTFSQNFLVMDRNDTWLESAPIPFSSVPYTIVGNMPYFAFLYDLQETQGNEHIALNASIQVSGTTIWNSTEAIELNVPGATYLTLKPLGNGADMALLIPVSLFAGKGLTGTSTLVFRSMQSDGQDGNDEWMFSSAGQFFDPTDPITVVPEPVTPILFLSGAVLLGLGRFALKLAFRSA